MTVRLLKVIVQPVYVADRGDDLVELPVDPIAISAADWRALDPQRWAEEGAVQVEAQMVAPAAEPTPNRATRRHPPKKAASA